MLDASQEVSNTANTNRQILSTVTFGESQKDINIKTETTMLLAGRKII